MLVLGDCSSRTSAAQVLAPGLGQGFPQPPQLLYAWQGGVQWYVDQVLGDAKPKLDRELFFTDPAVRKAFKARLLGHPATCLWRFNMSCTQLLARGSPKSLHHC